MNDEWKPDYYSEVGYWLRSALGGERAPIENIWKAIAKQEDDPRDFDEVKWLRHVARQVVRLLLSDEDIDSAVRGQLALMALGLHGRSDPDYELRRAIELLDIFENHGPPVPRASRTEEVKALQKAGFLKDVKSLRVAAKRVDRVKKNPRR